MKIWNEDSRGYLAESDGKYYIITYDEMGDLLSWSECVAIKSKTMPFELDKHFDFSKKEPIEVVE